MRSSTTSPNAPLHNFTFTDKVFGEGSYGWFVSGLGKAYTAIEHEITNLTFVRNVWARDPADYRVRNNSFPSTMASIGFVHLNNGNGGDYHLAASSPFKRKATDGSDPGANMDTLAHVLNNATAGIAVQSTESK